MTSSTPTRGRAISANSPYGGDLALAYPVFSARVRKIFASGTHGSFSAIYARCYNAPAHCIPNVLEWMDRAENAIQLIVTPDQGHEMDNAVLLNFLAD